MLYTVAFVVATVLGFAGSRLLRRPASAAQAASVARTVGGSLGARRGLDAPELQRACFSEMVRHVRVNRRGRTTAPGRYLLKLHPDDLAVVDDSRRWFTDGLLQALRDAASRNNWSLDGPVEVTYEADPHRRPGAPLAVVVADDSRPVGPTPSAASTAQGRHRTDGRPPAAPVPSAMWLVRADTGARVDLDGTPVTVGRAADNTITSLDERISRAHARFERAGSSWVVVDLGSANGTRVDGVRIASGRPVPVAPGSVVGVGPLDLTVKSGRPPADGAGTRALDHAERTRISAEVLGLPGRGPRP